MSRLLAFLTAVIVLAILRAALAALLVALAVLLLYSFITRPLGTLAFVGTITMLGLASAQPVAFIIAFATVALALIVVGAWQRHPRSRLLTDGREHH